MKHIKHFEYNYSLFNPGDIVILNNIEPKVGLILNIDKKGEFESSCIYHVLLHNNKEIDIVRNQIHSFPTPLDTDDVKMMVDNMKIISTVSKYNL